MNTTTNQLTSLQRSHLSQRMPNKMTQLRSEMQDIKDHLRSANEAMKMHDWSTAQDIFNEISCMATELMVKAEQNKIAKGY